MKFIEIAALENGAHRNQEGGVYPGEGWAIVPEEIEIPETYPFVGIEVEDGIVTAMTAGVVPEPEPVTPQPTQIDRIEAQVLYTALMTDTILEEG